MSSDRLQRVKISECEKNEKSSNEPNSTCVSKCDTISISDWCLFEKINNKKCLIGNVLSFAYLNGKTWKSTEYSSTFANVNNNRNPIGILCQWFRVDSSGNLMLTPLAVHGYIGIQQYRLTLQSKLFTDSSHAATLTLRHEIYCVVKEI